MSELKEQLEQQKQETPSEHIATKLLRWVKNSRKSMLITVGSLVLIGAAFVAREEYVSAHTVEFYKVYMAGQEVGTVNNKALVDQLINIKLHEVQQKYPNLHMKLNSNQITYAVDKQYMAEVNSSTTLAKLDELIKPTASGVSLVINGETIGIVKDQATADELLSKVKQKYEPDSTAPQKLVKTLSVSAQDASKGTKSKMSRVESVGFVEKVSTPSAQVDPSQIISEAEAYKMVTEGKDTPTTYTVQKGDTVSQIAARFDISQDELYANNPEISETKLQIGTELTVTVPKPLLTVSTVEKVTENVVTEPQIEYRTDSSMLAGKTKVIREGKSGLKQMSYMLTKHNGEPIINEWLGQTVITPSVSKIVVRGTKVVTGVGSGNFIWPVSNPTVTSPFGTRWGRMHKGIDIVGNRTIMAADDGVVTFVGVKNGYGNVMIVDHKNGYETLYGHLKGFSVKQGAVVEKGQAIAIMGNTGESTGTHLHFEIHKNGALRNPLSFL